VRLPHPLCRGEYTGLFGFATALPDWQGDVLVQIAASVASREEVTEIAPRGDGKRQRILSHEALAYGNAGVEDAFGVDRIVRLGVGDQRVEVCHIGIVRRSAAAPEPQVAPGPCR